MLRDLPEGLTRSSNHLQITDHFLIGMTLHLRRLRAPASNERAWKLRQKLRDSQDNSVVWLTEVELAREEHQNLLAVGSREARFNRYQYQFEDHRYNIDLYLGDLLGLIIARLKSPVDRHVSAPPPFAILEVTHHPLFAAEHLASSSTAEIRAALTGDEKSIDY